MKTGKIVEKALSALFLFSMGVFLAGWGAVWTHQLLTRVPIDELERSFGAVWNMNWQVKSVQRWFIILDAVWLLFVIAAALLGKATYHSRTISLTGQIKTPAAVGQGQHGTAAFMQEQDKTSLFAGITLSDTFPFIQTMCKRGRADRTQATEQERIAWVARHAREIDRMVATSQRAGVGVVVGSKHIKKKERLLCVSDDVHTLCIGSTRSGKTRTVVLQTIGALALGGESMVLSDPKGELFQYTGPFLEDLGYKVVTLDFRHPQKSHCFNFLQQVIDAVDNGDVPKAIDRTWDLTATLVGEPKGERIWTDGEASAIACAILAVVYDNRPRVPDNDRPEAEVWRREQDKERSVFRNMGNVYAFLANMCAPGAKGVLPLAKYMADLPEDHPAKALAAISRVAPSRTQGSFYTAALTTLRLFTNPNIHKMTSTSDFSPAEMGRRKTALFLILPDEKSTYYSLASLFVSQCYEQLVGVADDRGGRLERRVNFVLDEFGNFTRIPDFANKLTVGSGRGMRFTLFLQSFAQLKEKYGDDMARIIRGNCENWIYLQAEDVETLKEISERLGQYTVSSYSVSDSNKLKGDKSKSSHSMQLLGRSLLTPDEVRRIQRPYNLVLSRHPPALMYAPDVSQMLFNRMFGMGDVEHNRMLREHREQQRTAGGLKDAPEFWGIWRYYTE